jgi:cell division protein FtsI (penicillin-binding protein 3)
MLAIMETVTQEGGTAKDASPTGFTTAGKTGTAQKLVNRAYSHNKFNSLFIGMVPAHDPVLAIAVIIDEPKGAIYGGVVAAPIFKEIAGQSLRVLGYYPPSEPKTVLATLMPTQALAEGLPNVKEAALPPEAKKAVPQGPLKVMPDFKGMTKRQVLDLLPRTGLRCRFEGNGRAVTQMPAAGAPINPGSYCAVKFKPHS